jgi:hypothetical protein
MFARSGCQELGTAIPASLATLPLLDFFGFQGSPLCGVPGGVDSAPFGARVRVRYRCADRRSERTVSL